MKESKSQMLRKKMQRRDEPYEADEVSASSSNDGLCAVDCHTRCNDCGQILPKKLWVPKNHAWKKCALCTECFNKYDSPYDY